MARTIADVRARPSCATCGHEHRFGDLRVRNQPGRGREWFCPPCAAAIDAQAPLIAPAELEHYIAPAERWASLGTGRRP